MGDSARDVAVEAVRDRASLVRISAQWDDLARHALEPDPDPLGEMATTLASLEAAGEGRLQCCLSWARDPERADLPASLGGLFPFRLKRSAWGFPCWTFYPPLVRADGAQRHVAALLDWLERAGAAVVRFRHVPREGRLNDVLVEVLRDCGATVYGCNVAAPDGVGGPSLRDLLIGIGAVGGRSVAMVPMLDRLKRRIWPAFRTGSPAVAA